ncbi:MAG: heme ABC transporter ATP-binding protein [Saprospiraceae bacterium]|nr:heme ABC transporter ATP-binding protein [Saprospiraceae bacterium]
MSIRADKISLQIKKQEILKDISWEARSGQLSVIIGGNGAGKSSLLKVLTGQWKAQEGSVHYGNKTIDQYTQAELALKRAVLSQQIKLTFSMSVLDLVLLGRYPHVIHQVGRKDKEIAMNMLEKVGMQDFAKREIFSLSGGQQQRVHMARVLAQIGDSSKAQALFLDEPTNSLDIHYQHSLLDMAKQVAQEMKLTVIAVLHDMNLAARYADYIAVMKQGQLIQAGTPEKILNATLIKEAFGVESVILEHPVLNCLQVITYYS